MLKEKLPTNTWSRADKITANTNIDQQNSEDTLKSLRSNMSTNNMYFFYSILITKTTYNEETFINTACL